VLFALLPLAVSLLVIMPALGGGPAGVGLGMGLVPLGGELVRHVLYGSVLSTSYTLLTRGRAAAQAPSIGLSAP
jgi:hypothetical protein